MTPDRFEGTLDDWLALRGATAPGRIRANAMAAVGARRQRPGWWATLRVGITDAPMIAGLQPGRALRLFAVIIATLLVGVALGFGFGSRLALVPTATPSPHPTSTQSAPPTASASPSALESAVPTVSPSRLSAPVTMTEFVVPFTYQLPSDPAIALQLVFEESDLAGFAVGVAPVFGGNFGPLQTQSHGVAVVALGSPWTHPCPDSRVVHSPTPEEFLDLLAITGSWESAMSTTVDGRPALTTSVRADEGSCQGDIHYDQGPTRGSKYILTTVASQFTVFDVGSQTIVIDIWAQDDAEFEAWLPEATRFLESIHFVEQ